MKKIITFSLLSGLLIFNACKKSVTTSTEANPVAITPDKIDAFIRTQLQTEHKFEWSTASDEMIWSALEQSDHILSVGYQPAGETNVSDRLASIDINSIKWKTAKLQVLSLILKEEARTNAKLSIDKLEEWPEFVLPVMDIKVMNLSTVKALRASKLVRYAEPMG